MLTVEKLEKKMKMREGKERNRTDEVFGNWGKMRRSKRGEIVTYFFQFAIFLRLMFHFVTGQEKKKILKLHSRIYTDGQMSSNTFSLRFEHVVE